MITGRALITYDETLIELGQIITDISMLEDYMFHCKHNNSQQASPDLASRKQVRPNLANPNLSYKEVAAAGESVQASDNEPSLVNFKQVLIGIPAVVRSRKDMSLTALRSVVSDPRQFLRGMQGNPEQVKLPGTKRSSADFFHAMNPNDILSRFSVQEQTGLTTEQVAKLRTQYGINKLQPPKLTPWLFSYLEQFKEFPTLVILGATMLAFASGDLYDGLAMGSVLIANAAIGTVQERKAEKAIVALNRFRPSKCRVLRESTQVEIDGTELVPGDIVYLEPGDRVPADLRLLHSLNLEVNEAALTGESLAVGKHAQIIDAETLLAERKNMLYMGTDVTRGKGIGIVIGTGMETEMGWLMSLMKEPGKAATPLHENVTRISKKFFKWAAIAGGLVFIAGLVQGMPLTQMISISITLAASAIPEGLPVMITIALSAGIFRMAKKNALIRKMSALETLGRITVICTDKTGTLTKNEMTVKKVATAVSTWRVTGNGYEPVGEVVEITPPGLDPGPISVNPDVQLIARIGLLCNNSELQTENECWKTKGDPTEGALLTFAGKSGLRPENLKNWQRVHEVPFDSSTGTMSVVCLDRDEDADQAYYVFSKGSVEAILEQCRWYQKDGMIYQS